MEPPATPRSSVVVMLVARDLLLQAFALSVEMLSRAPSCAGHAPQLSVRADKAEEGDAASSRAAGGASAGAGGRAIRRPQLLLAQAEKN